MSEEINWIYIGETISELGIRRNMMILGTEPPPQIKNLMELKPMVRSLYIPTSRLAEARRNLRMEGSLESIAFAETRNYREKLRQEKERK